PDGALDDVALAQAVLAYLGERDVHIVRPGEVAGGADEGIPLRVEHVEDAGDRDEHVILADHGLGVGLTVAPAGPGPEPVPAAAPAVALVVLLARVPAAGRHRLPVPAAALLAAAVAAALVPSTLVTTALVAVVAAALVAPAAVPAAVVAAALVPAALV